MSALTFDLAIELLMCIIRNSRKIKGFHVPHVPSNILINLFTDNMTIYLAKEDRYEDLQDILSR